MKHRQISVGKIGAVNSDGHSIGLDIGATSVRAAILAPGRLDGRPSVTMHGLGHLPLAPGTVVNGAVMDPAALTTALKQLWKINKFNCSHVILGVANPQALVRDMKIPRLTPQQRIKALPFLARDVVALPIDQVTLDFVPLGDPEGETELIHGLLIATPRQPVLTAVGAVERAGLKVARVDLSSFAVLRSIADQHLSVEAVIDMGAQLTTIVIHHQGVPKLVRTLARGGQEVTDRIADRLSLTGDEAELSKQSGDLAGSPTGLAGPLNEAIRPLLGEIRSSINYFRSANDGAQLERISLTGGASGLAGLADVIAQQNGVTTTVVTPLQHIRNLRNTGQTYTEGSEDTASAVSVGLAMGAAA